MRFLCSLLFLLLLCMGSNTFAQRVYTSSGKPTKAQRSTPAESKGFNPDKLIFGGGLGAGFGRSTYFSISPVVGYRFTDALMAGIGLGYQYYKVRDYYQISGVGSYDAKQHIFSPSLWGRFAFLENFFAQAEYEYNYINTSYPGFDPNGSGNVVNLTESFTSPNLLLGGGIRQRVTDRSSLLLTVLYNVLDGPNNIYANQPLIIRVGFVVGY